MGHVCLFRTYKSNIIAVSVILLIGVSLVFVGRRINHLEETIWEHWMQEAECSGGVCSPPAERQGHRPPPRWDDAADKLRQSVLSGVWHSAFMCIAYSIACFTFLAFDWIVCCVPPWLRAAWPWLARGFAVVPLKWKRRYGLPVPPAPADVIRINRLGFWLILIMSFTPGVLAALVVLLSPGLYDPFADPPPTVSVPAVILADEAYRTEWTSIVTLAFMAILAFLGWERGRRYRARVWDMEALLDDGVPVCLDCGGRLDGVKGPACPRCSAPWSRWYPAEHGRPVLPGPATSRLR
jgi:hypothetical protein